MTQMAGRAAQTAKKNILNQNTEEVLVSRFEKRKLLTLKLCLILFWFYYTLKYQQRISKLTDFPIQFGYSPPVSHAPGFPLISTGFYHLWLHAGFLVFLPRLLFIDTSVFRYFHRFNPLTGGCGLTGRLSYSRLRASATFSAALFSACSSCWMPCDWLAMLEQKNGGQRRWDGAKHGENHQNEGRRSGGLVFFLYQLQSADATSRCGPLTWLCHEDEYFFFLLLK